jgi:hypothetical protein
MRRLALLATLAAIAIPLPAQIEEDPRQKMQEILNKVAEEMQLIDKWLQESSRSKDAAKGMSRNIAQLEKLLDSVGKSQQEVVKGIDDLLNQAQKMKSQGDKSDPSKKKNQQRSQQQRRQRQQQQRDGQQQKRRRELQKPQQRPQQPEDQKGKKQDQAKRDQNGKEKRDKGKNLASKDPNKRGTEKVNGKKIQGAWGDLPDYILKHGRGSMPNVPEKYRKYLEALTKEGHKKKDK